MDEDDYIYIMKRIDDVINVAGHRLSTGGMEEVLASHPAVAECAVFGINCALKGEIPMALVVIKDGVNQTQQSLSRELIQSVRDKIGTVAAFKTVAVVKRTPKTRSGKILRSTLRSLVNGE